MRLKIPRHWRYKILDWFARAKDRLSRLSQKFRYLQDDLYEFNRKANPWLHGLSVSLSIAVILSLLIPLFFEDPSEYTSITKR